MGKRGGWHNAGQQSGGQNGGAAECRGPKGTVTAVTSCPGCKYHSFGTVVTLITETNGH